MAKIEPTTVAIAAAAAYLLLRPKDASAGGSVKRKTSGKGDCYPGFAPNINGVCVPENETCEPGFSLNAAGACEPDFSQDPIDPGTSGGSASKYAIQSLAGNGTDDPDIGPGGFAQVPGDPAQPLPPIVDYEALMTGLLNADGYPQQGRFYQVKKNDTFNKITAQALADAAYESTFAKTANEAQASAMAQAAFDSGSFRKAYRDLILCSPYNDYLYGTHAYSPGVPASGLTGRAIRLRPKQFDNLARMISGEPPARNEQWGTPADQNQGGKSPVFDGENKYELLWLPGINVDKIVNQNGQSLGTLETKNYPNSEWTTVVPPPVLWQLGVVDYDDQNAPGSVGCGYYEADIGP